MLSILKIAKASQLVGAKLITAKAVVGGGMLAGSLATGMVLQTGLPADYIEGASALISNAVDAESALASAGTSEATYRGEPLSAVRADFADAAVMYVLPMKTDTRSQSVPNAEAIPQLIVIGKHMSVAERASYDAEMRSMALATK